MSSNKFRRAYSLRIPRSPKPAAFLDSSSFYDRLDERESQDDYQGQNDALGKKDNSFSWEIPLITEAPKLHYCRKKWSSKSLRLPKSRQSEPEPPVCQPEDVAQMDDDIYDSNQEPERPSSSEGRRLSNDSESHKETENEGQRQKSKKMKHYKKRSVEVSEPVSPPIIRMKGRNRSIQSIGRSAEDGTRSSQTSTLSPSQERLRMPPI